MNIHILDKLISDSTVIIIRSFEAEEYIFYQGDPAYHIFVVEKGQVKLTRYTIEGRSVVIQTAKAGESFAEAALFSEVYHCNAIATVPSQVIFYPKHQILNTLRQYPEKTEEFIALLAFQVRALRTRLELRNILSARERILHYFLLRATPDNPEVVIQDLLKDIAAELGLAHETFYRELAKLEKDGIIQRNGKKILHSTLV
jgi:CRP-like cAMP-binding protein